MDERTALRTPDWKTILLEQVQLIGLRFRGAGVALLVLGLLVGAAFVWFLHRMGTGVIASRDIALANHALSAHARAKLAAPIAPMHVIYSPAIIASLLPLALLLPLAMWQDEPPTRRDYHLTMPVSSATHTLIRVLAGWSWVMLFTAVFLVAVVSVPAMVDWFPGALPVHTQYATWWEWLVPFTAMSVAYIYASSAAVGARRPLVWLGGPVILYAGTIGLFITLRMPQATAKLLAGAAGFYGAAAAMAGQVDVEFGVPSPSRWLGATVIWGLAAIALLLGISHRRAEA